MEHTVKAGIIGFGYMGHFHLEHAKKNGKIEVLAAYDNDPHKLVQDNGIKCCGTLEELLSMQELDLIIICTPNQFHKYYAIEALNAAKHVLCEKPVTLNADEAREITACAKKNGKIFTVHQNRRWDADYLVVQEVYRAQLIGEFTTINSCTYGQRGVCFGWRADPKMGGGMLYDWGVHLLDQILQLYEGIQIKKIYGRLESILTPYVDDYFEVKLIFENGVCANLSVGTFALQPTPRWYIFGDRGTLKLDDFSGMAGGMARIKGSVKEFERGKTSLGPSRTMAHLKPENLEEIPLPRIKRSEMEFYDNLVDAIHGNGQPVVTTRQIIRLMEVVDKIFISSLEGSVLDVDL